MGRFFKDSPNLNQNWLKFKKILEKSVDFAQNLAKNWTDWYMNGSLFLEKLVFVWVYFQIPWRHIPTKPNLSTPPPDRTIVNARLLDTPGLLDTPVMKTLPLDGGGGGYSH